MRDVEIERVYDTPAAADGYRALSILDWFHISMKIRHGESGFGSLERRLMNPPTIVKIEISSQSGLDLASVLVGWNH